MAKNIGAKIVLEGAAEYKENIKSINAEQKLLQSELKLTASEFEGQENSLAALEQKQEIYTKQLDVQNQKLQEYQKMLESAQNAQEQSGSKVESLSKQLEEAQKAYEDMAESGNATTEELENQKEAIENIASQLEIAKESYSRAGDAVNDWQTKCNIAQVEVNNLNSRIEENAGYIEEARNSTDKCATSIDEFGKKTGEAKEQVNGFGEIMAANFTADVLAQEFENLIGLIKSAGEEMIQMGISAAYLADEINTLSTQTGISTDTIQELRYAEELMDVSVETITGSMRKNLQSMEKAQSGAEKYAETYQKLGIQITNADGSLRNSEEVYWEVIDALGRMTNATERDATAMELFGRNAQQLNPLIEKGSAGFKALAQEAHDVGYVMDKDTLKGLNNVSDSLARASKYADTLKNEIGSEMAPEIERALSKIIDKVDENKDAIMDMVEGAVKGLTDALVWIIDNGDTILGFMGALGAAFLAYKAYGAIMAVVNSIMAAQQLATEGATIAQLALNTAMEMNPVGAIVAAVAALVAGLVAFAKAMEDNPISNLQKEVQDLKEECEESKQAFDDNSASIEQQSKTAGDLSTKIADLQKKEKLSNEEKKKMEEYVGKLNKIYPNLNVQIDENTGKIKEGTDAIEAQIQAQKDLLEEELRQERMKELLEEQIQLEEQFAETKAQITALAQEEGKSIEEFFANSMDVWHYANQDLIDQYYLLKDSIAETNTQYEQLSDASSDYAEQQAQANEAAQLAKEYQIQLGDQMYAVSGITEETAGKVMGLAEAYNDAYNDALESVRGQIGLFGELKVEAEKSVNETTENFKRNTEIMTEYSQNMALLAKAADIGLLDSGLFEDIKELGLDGAGYVKELAAAFQESGQSVAFVSQEAAQQILDQNHAYRDQAEAMEEVADVLTEDYKTAAEEALGVTEESFKAMEEAAEESIGTIIEIMGNGELTEATTEAMEEAVNATKQVFQLDEQGTSQVFVEIGEAIPESMCQGIENGRQSLIDKMDSVIDSMISRINARKQDIATAVDKALGDATT